MAVLAGKAVHGFGILKDGFRDVAIFRTFAADDRRAAEPGIHRNQVNARFGPQAVFGE